MRYTLLGLSILAGLAIASAARGQTGGTSSAEPETTEATKSAERTGVDPALSSATPSTPVTGVLIEVGQKEQRIAGRFSIATRSGIAGDLTLSGANVDKTTERSDLLHTLAKAPGGEIAIGVTYTSFSFDEKRHRKMRSLCKAQNERNGLVGIEDKVKAAFATLEAKEKAFADAKAAFDASLLQTPAVDATKLKAAEEKSTQAAAAEVAARLKHAESLEKVTAAREAVRAAATGSPAVQAQAAAKLVDAEDDERRAYAVAEQAQAVAGKAAAELSALRAQGVSDAQSAMDRARADVGAAKAEAERLAALLAKNCVSESGLDDASDLPGWPLTTFVAFARASVGSKSIDYFDTTTGKADKSRIHPTGLSGGLGAFLIPSGLAAASVRWMRDRSSGDVVSVCQDQPVAGVTTTPPTLACRNLALGAPGWKQAVALRFEWRQLFSDRIGWNPSLTYTYSDQHEAFPIFKSAGAWAFELPLYFRIEPSNPKNPFVFGAAMRRAETFGLGSKNESSTDLFAFLAASFDLGFSK